MRSVIIGTGSYLPEKILTNDELPAGLDTSDEWIRQRTGITQRHVAAPDQVTSDLAHIACQRALANAGITANDIDLLILATTTPDLTFPATACQVQRMLGAKSFPAMDIQAACTGFIYTLTLADSMLRANPSYKRALVVGAEIFTRLVDWTDRSTCVLFGDGAGAVVLEKQPHETERGILGTYIDSDGTNLEMLRASAGVSYQKAVGKILMNGREVFRIALQKLSQAMETVLAQTNTKASDLAWFVPHQANRRIISAMAQHIKLPEEKIIYTVQKHANTSAASIPLALDDANQQGLLKPGDLILMDALGAGITWGAALVRW